ncbi:MAG TPA: hypothetical protein VFQ54_09035, partial [Thermomicrobiales bacterium]|nr:hypothetical protein [Thermomicrobiales bacterium]
YFNTDPHGNDVVIFNGVADGDEKSLDPTDAAAYLFKYRSGIEGLGMSPESFANDYSRVITVDLTKVRGWIG